MKLPFTLDDVPFKAVRSSETSDSWRVVNKHGEIVANNLDMHQAAFIALSCSTYDTMHKIILASHSLLSGSYALVVDGRLMEGIRDIREAIAAFYKTVGVDEKGFKDLVSETRFITSKDVTDWMKLPS